MVDAMLAASTRVEIDTDGPVVDIVGTGGDRAHTINVSHDLVAGGRGCRRSRVQAREPGRVLGLRVGRPARGARRRDRARACRSGPRASRRRGSGSASRPATTRRCATPVHPGGTSGIPTAFNILGPLANPGRVRRYLIGVADERMADAHGRGARAPTAPSGRSSSTEATASTSSRRPGRRRVVELRDGAVTDLGGAILETSGFPGRSGGPRRRRCAAQRRPGPAGARG